MSRRSFEWIAGIAGKNLELCGDTEKVPFKQSVKWM